MGLEIDELGEHVDSGGAVDRGVVHLGDDGRVAVLEALHHPHLPERPGAVELARRDVADDIGQLVRTPRGRHRDPTHVMLEIEPGILDPHRVVERERDRHEPPPEGGDPVDALGDEPPEGVGREPTLDPRRIEDRRGA